MDTCDELLPVTSDQLHHVRGRKKRLSVGGVWSEPEAMQNPLVPSPPYYKQT